MKTVAGEHMIIDAGQHAVDMNRVFSLNDPAAWLWNKIGVDEFDESMLVDWLCGEYDVSTENAQTDVHNMICLWRKFGMLI